MKYLFLDTETGGIGLDKSLLTASFILTDEDFNELDVLDLFVKPDDKIYHCTAEALSINNINLIKHDKIAITHKEAAKILYDFLKKWSNGGKEKLIVVGKNVYFDLTHIWDKLISRGTWETFVSYQIVDLTTVWKMLEICGKVAVLSKTSLSNLAEYFNINFPSSIQHTSKSDTEITLHIYKRCLELLRDINPSSYIIIKGVNAN